MSRNDTIKNIINNNINKDKIYQNILNNANNKNNILKYLILSTSFILILFIGITMLNNKKYHSDSNVRNYILIDDEDKREIKIDTYTTSTFSSYNSPFKIDISKWIIPNNINEKHVYELYENNKSKDEYLIVYTSNNSQINIKLLKEININTNEKNNNIEIIKNESNDYLAIFKYKDYYYLIETVNISKKELDKLIDSIMEE